MSISNEKQRTLEDIQNEFYAAQRVMSFRFEEMFSQAVGFSKALSEVVEKNTDKDTVSATAPAA